MKKVWMAVAALLVGALIVTGCTGFEVAGVDVEIIQGSGNSVTESRNVSGFDTIVLDTSADLVLTQGSAESVEVTADDNLVDYFVAEVSGRTLTLRYGGPVGGYNSRTPVTFTVVATDLVEVTAGSSGDIDAGPLEAQRLTLATRSSGSVTAERVLADEVTLRTSSSGAVTVDDLEAESLNVEATSSGNVTARGRVGDQEVTLGSSGDYRGGDLQSATARVQVGSSGTATVWATDSLNASTSSSGNVEFYGDPDLRQSATSSGEVRSLGSK